MRPLARRDGLVVRDLAGETLVYDRECHQAHCLNPTSAAVFRLCDGERSPGEIAALLAEGDAAARLAVVELALQQLSTARLLCEGDRPGASASGCDQGADDRVTSRRELLRLAALALPAIASIVAPPPAQAASVCIPVSGCADPLNSCAPCDPFGGDCSGYSGYQCNGAGGCTYLPPECS